MRQRKSLSKKQTSTNVKGQDAYGSVFAGLWFQARNNITWKYVLALAVMIPIALFWKSKYTYQNTNHSQRATENLFTRPIFVPLIQKFGHDSTENEGHHLMYDQYMRYLQGKSIRILEVGVHHHFTDSKFPVRRYLWSHKFPALSIHPRSDWNYDGEWSTERVLVYNEQQGTDAFVDGMRELAENENNYDIVINAGRLTNKEQFTNIEILMNTIRPDGVYFFSDPANKIKVPGEVGVDYMEELYADQEAIKLGQSVRHEISKKISNVECLDGICALTKVV